MWGISYADILEEQYWLSRRGHISVIESNQMAEFERSFFVSLVYRDIKAENDSYDKAEQEMKSSK